MEQLQRLAQDFKNKTEEFKNKPISSRTAADKAILAKLKSNLIFKLISAKYTVIEYEQNKFVNLIDQKKSKGWSDRNLQMQHYVLFNHIHLGRTAEPHETTCFYDQLADYIKQNNKQAGDKLKWDNPNLYHRFYPIFLLEKFNITLTHEQAKPFAFSLHEFRCENPTIIKDLYFTAHP